MNGSFVVLNIQIFVRLDIRVWHIPKGLSDFVFYGKKFKNKSIVSFDSDTNASHDELFFTCVKYSAIWWRWYFVIGLWHSGQSRRFWHQRSAVRIQSSAIILYYIWLLLTVWMWGRWWTFKNEVSLKLIHKVFSWALKSCVFHLARQTATVNWSLECQIKYAFMRWEQSGRGIPMIVMSSNSKSYLWNY